MDYCEHVFQSSSTDEHPPAIPAISLVNDQVELRWCLACGQIELINKLTGEINVLKPGIYAISDEDSSESEDK